MNNVLFLVGFEAGFFDNVIKLAAVPYFFKFKFGVRFVGGNQRNRADAENAVRESSSEAQVDYAEHIDVVDLSVEYASRPLNAVCGNFIMNAS